MGSKCGVTKEAQQSFTYHVRIHIQCLDRFGEIVPDEGENIELAVEELVGHCLLTMFAFVIIDEVSIIALPAEVQKNRYYSLSIYARALDGLSSDREQIEQTSYTLEELLGNTLLELFDAVRIDYVEVR